MTTKGHTPKPGARLLRIGDAAELAQVSVDTLRRWADEGLVRHVRTPTGERRFRRDDIEALSRPTSGAKAVGQ